MQKSQILLLVTAIAIIIGLFYLPKVLVKSNKQVQISGTSGTVDTVSNSSNKEVHTSQLTSEQMNTVGRLRNGFINSSDNNKKVVFADSLAGFFEQLNRPDSAAHYIEEIALINPGLKNWIRTGDAYYEAFRFSVDNNKSNQMGEKTREFYEKVLSENPKELDVKSRMAMTYVSTSNPMQGIAILREVIAEDPDNQTALFNLGLLAMQSKQWDKAIGRFKQILALHPNDMESHFYLGVSYANFGSKEEARKELQIVTKKEKDPALLQAANDFLKTLN